MSAGRVLVTGATGLIGRRLVAALLAEDTPVRVFTRGRSSPPPEWAGRVETAIGDLADPAALASACAGCAQVFHLAGEWRAPDCFRAVNVDGTRQVLRAAASAGAQHVVHLSSVGVMGTRAAGPVDEAAPCRPRDPYEQSKLEAEQWALLWAGETGVPVAALRPTIVFGPRPAGEADSLLVWLRALQAGRYAHLDRRAVANYVYVDDVAAACLAAAARRAHGVFIVADPCPLADFVAAMAEALGVPAPRAVIPLPLAYLGALGLGLVSAVLRRPNPLTLARVRALSNRTLFRSTQSETALGWRPLIGYRAGLARTVLAYRRAGQL